MKIEYKRVTKSESRYDSEYVVLLDGEKIGNVYSRGSAGWEGKCSSGYEVSHNTRASTAKELIDRYYQDVARAAEAKVWILDGIEHLEAVTGPSLAFQIRNMSRGVVKMIDGAWYPVKNGQIIDWTGSQFSGGAIAYL